MTVNMFLFHFQVTNGLAVSPVASLSSAIALKHCSNLGLQKWVETFKVYCSSVKLILGADHNAIDECGLLLLVLCSGSQMVGQN